MFCDLLALFCNDKHYSLQSTFASGKDCLGMVCPVSVFENWQLNVPEWPTVDAVISILIIT